MQTQFRSSTNNMYTLASIRYVIKWMHSMVAAVPLSQEQLQW